MKTNLRGKIREFVQSEDGKVGIKSPLTLGVATGGILLAQVIMGTPQADAHETCWIDDDCVREDHDCHNADPDNGVKGTCY